MARLPYVEAAEAPESVRKVLERLPLQLNIFRMMAHAETAFRPLLRLGTAILGEQQLDPKLRELAILQATRLTPGTYEWVQHVPIARAVGASAEQIDALERGDYEAGCFDERERVLLRFGAATLRDAKVPDALFEAAARHFSPREIVEIVITLGYYSMLSRLTEVTETDLDAAAGTKIVDALPG